LEIFLPLEGILDFQEETRRLQKEIGKLEPELARAKKKLTNEDFLGRAPAEVVAKERRNPTASVPSCRNSRSNFIGW